MSRPQILECDYHWPREFDRKKSFVLISRQLGDELKDLIYEALWPELDQHLWLLSSGTSNAHHYKFIGLSFSAIEASSRAVNQHLQVNPKDIWGASLPVYHIGGFSIYYRAELSGIPVFAFEKWQAHDFISFLERHQVTLTSLVPTQVFDLVQLQLRAPQFLRAIVVGGGALSDELYIQARQLGWPLLPSYGMTEAASQVATAELSSLQKKEVPPLKILNHLKAKTREDQRLVLSGDSLFSGYFFIEDKKTWFEPQAQTDFVTQDRAELMGDHLTPLGRADHLMKISGELTDLQALQKTLDGILIPKEALNKALVISLPHSRRENEVALVFDLSLKDQADELAQLFNQKVRGFERVSRLFFVREIPLSDLKKIKVGAVKKLLGLSS